MIELAPGERIYVLAGAYRVAMDWARKQGLHRDQVVHLRDPIRQLQGAPRGLRYVVLYGGERTQETRAYLAYREAVEVDP